MSQWHQHYYTWSTNSLSGNKVGLGIVAASNTERDYIRIAGIEAAKCSPYREKENMVVERLTYSNELPGFVRTGTVPTEQSADKRNNKFVHVFSSSWEEFTNPENYLCPLPFQRTWGEEKDLEPLYVPDESSGRGRAVSILKKYGLEKRLPHLFYAVYHCMFAAEKPLLIMDDFRNPEDFGNFSREMMILVHYLLPKSLRKDADYVSYVTETTQEAHFVFSDKLVGKHIFSIKKQGKKKEYTLLEKEFFDQLSEAFLKSDEEYDSMLHHLDHILQTLADRRNQLEKCILTIMASNAGKQKKREDYYVSMERLMYWARKDQSLIKPLEDSIRELDYQSMTEEELLAYTKLMITGAGGETKSLVFEHLDQMLLYYFRTDKWVFENLIRYIRDNHSSLYEELLIENDREDSFTKSVLYTPIENVNDLEYEILFHEYFLKKKEYREYLVSCACVLYRQEKQEKKQDKIARLAKEVDEDQFIQWKKKEIEKIVEQADGLEELLSILNQMNMERLEHPIQTFLFRRAVFFLKQEKKISVQSEKSLCDFADQIGMSDKMNEEIRTCYERELSFSMKKMTPAVLIESVFTISNRTDKKTEIFVSEKRTSLFQKVMDELLAKEYLFLLKEKENDFLSLNTEKWIRFVLKLSGKLEKNNPDLAKKMIQETKKVILKSNDLSLLAKVNHTLKNHGIALIHCPESLWKEISLENMDDFKNLYLEIGDLSFVRCEKSEIYQMAKKLFEYADSKNGDIDEKTRYAWNRYEKRMRKETDEDIGENRWKKVLLYAWQDILSKSIWAVLFGFYGFLFVSIREKVAIMPGYIPSVAVLILLVIVYGLRTFFCQKKEDTPGTVIYMMGVGILLMNWGLALDTMTGVVILYAASLILSILAKAAHYIFFIREKDAMDDED